MRLFRLSLGLTVMGPCLLVGSAVAFAEPNRDPATFTCSDLQMRAALIQAYEAEKEEAELFQAKTRELEASRQWAELMAANDERAAFRAGAAFLEYKERCAPGLAADQLAATTEYCSQHQSVAAEDRRLKALQEERDAAYRAFATRRIREDRALDARLGADGERVTFDLFVERFRTLWRRLDADEKIAKDQKREIQRALELNPGLYGDCLVETRFD